MSSAVLIQLVRLAFRAYVALVSWRRCG